MPSAIRHVLFDADGVLQVVRDGWYAAAEPFLGDRASEFMHRAWSDELSALSGRVDYLPLLADLLPEYDVAEPADLVHRDVWCRIDRIEESLGVVEALRCNGYGVHLGTNQERHRGGYLRETCPTPRRSSSSTTNPRTSRVPWRPVSKPLPGTSSTGTKHYATC